MAQQTKKTDAPTHRPAVRQHAAQGIRAKKNTLPQGVTALQTWLEDHGWKRH